MRPNRFAIGVGALAVGAILWACPALASQQCSVDTDCTEAGTACGTDTCDPSSYTCVPADTTAQSSCQTDSQCKCTAICNGAGSGSGGITAATAGTCSDVTGKPAYKSDGECSVAIGPGAPTGWASTAALGAIGLLFLLLRTRRSGR